MNAYIQPTDRRVAPFGDPAGEIPVLNRPLAVWQAEALAGAGLKVVASPTPPCLVIPDNLFCTAGALRKFIDGAAGRDAVLVLGDCRFGRNTTHVQPAVYPVEGGWRFDRVRFVSGRGEPPVEVKIDVDEQTLDLPLPNHFIGTEKLEIGLPRDPVMEINHWVHILWLNQVAGSVELRNTPPWKGALRALWAAMRAFSFNKWKVLSKLNTIGKGCDIHPTAVVEGSTLGNNVSIGAFSRVLLSRLDDGASVMSGSEVDFSVMGKGSVLSENCVLRFSVLYPEAVSSQYLMQQCVLGRRAVTTGGSFSIDLNFDQDIRVPLDGQLWSTGSRFIGSAFGHRARVGTGFWLASGRMVPNGAFLIRNPDEVLSRIPEDLPPGPAAVIGKGVKSLAGPGGQP